MRLRSGWVLGLVAGAIAATGAYAAHELAMARQKPIVVMRFLAGYFDRKGKFVATAGRGAANVDRNAVLMFVMSGAPDTGPNLKATLPLTLSEQAELETLTVKVRDGTATAREERRFRELGGDLRVLLEPGVIGRRNSTDPAAQIVATGSISTESVRIVATSGGGESLADGVFFKVKKRRGRRVRARRFVFHPQYTVATFGKPAEVDYNPEGFEANTTYQIQMQGGAGTENLLTVVTNRDGIPLAEPFQTTITTSDRYVQDFTRPEIRETFPTDGAVNVASDADIEVTFSEPMDVATFQTPRSPDDPAATIVVRYTQSPANGALAGRNVLGQVRVRPQTAGNVVQFRPLQGFGQGPYEIEATITAGVTDLSGNNIIREQTFVFTTEFDSTAEDIGALSETFDDNAFQDTDFFSDPANLSGDNDFAIWNVKSDPGVLKSSVTDLTFDTGTNNNSINIWHSSDLRWQMLFPSNDMGGRPRTITGFSFLQGPAVFNLTYPNTSVTIGHANDTVAGGGFPGGTAPPGPSAGYYRATPTVVVPATNYTTPPAVSGYVPGPIWAKNFSFDGKNAVILEIQHAGNGVVGSEERWGMDGTYSLNACTFSSVGLALTATQPWYLNTRWNYVTPGAEAQSTWYNVMEPSVRWVPQQIVPFLQPQGTQISFRWQGSQADFGDPSVRDPSTVTPWTTDIRTLAGNPFVRWHVELVNNLTDRTAPRIDTLTAPYTFR